MKIPCEIVVWYVLPMIRRELAKELVFTHKFSQAEVARRFGVTDAAISQYLRKKRGDNENIETSAAYPKFKEAIRQSAKRIVEKGSDCSEELCILCGIAKQIGLLADIYQIQLDVEPPRCARPGNCALKDL